MADDAKWLETEAKNLAARAQGHEKHVAVAMVKLAPDQVKALLDQFGAAPLDNTNTPTSNPTLLTATIRPQQGGTTLVALMVAPSEPESDG